VGGPGFGGQLLRALISTATELVDFFVTNGATRTDPKSCAWNLEDPDDRFVAGTIPPEFGGVTLAMDDFARNIGREITENFPEQIHHLLSNKHFSKWTDMFKAIADKYGLSLEGDWNKILIPQQGSHAEEYHQWVYNTLINIDKIANGNKEKFLELFDRKIKQIVLNNPWIVNRQWWKTILKRKP
jgi:hypothetical protein